ncbi:MAG: hypothetical protein EB050_02580, partial [Actinobacteria bacterium]|nr:hypothetical protein [Actinomycetota bacterium]
MVQKGEIVWKPDADRVGASRLTEFANGLDFEALHESSVKSPEEFWRKVWSFCDVIGEQGERVIHKNEVLNDPSAEF